MVYRRVRFFIPALAVILLLTFTTSCGSSREDVTVQNSSTQVNDKITVRLITSWGGVDTNADTLQQIIDGFMADNNDINVVNESLFGGDFLNVAIVSNKGEQIVNMNPKDKLLLERVMQNYVKDGKGYFIDRETNLPMITPSIATMSIFTFITSWNNYLVPLVILTNEKNYTVPIMVAMAKGVYRTDFGAVYAAIALAIVPIIVVFAFCSKYIIGGLTAGALK